MSSDILIVGAGPTGLLLAAGLARYGIKPRLIDKNPYPSKTSKALSLYARTLEVFDDLGMAEEAIAQGFSLQGFNLYANCNPIAHVDLSQRRSHFPNAMVVPQSDTEALLGRALERLDVPVERSVTLTRLEQGTDCVTATLSHADGREERYRAAWLIGCDGAGSTVRKAASLVDDGMTIPVSFVLADVEMSWDLCPREAHVFFTSDGVLATFPLPQKNSWRIIANVPIETELPDELDLQLFEELVQKRSHLTPKLSALMWTSHFRVRQRMVRQCRNGRVLVAGDALSSHSPIGGQGMNTGLQDAYNLAWKLALVVQGKASIDLLDSYAAERLPISKSLLLATGLGTQMLLLQQPGVQQLRQLAIQFLLGLAPVQDRMIKTLIEFDVNYRNSPIVQDDPAFLLSLHTRQPNLNNWLAFRNGPQAGDRAPDVEVETADGTKRLFQVFSDELKHTLLLFAGTSDLANDARLNQSLQEFASFSHWMTVHLVWPSRQIPDAIAPDESVLLDPQTHCHQQYGATGECLYLIRPDGYIGYRSQSLYQSQLQAYFRQLSMTSE
ncbi:FAD-dependent monooxygenase [Oculatella sp. LEGE 06141]|uniref:FAD-dependent monooxygenase n=1 Tax=Oculatella sp. LEGE 06141 TaxID=1828648 RepID=UPI001881BA33|nr:FAD-dependent monooxygenase [Oculatella sp. LEGE 06141]MBE9182017.1 FAD-dependent monooxygenase [Oculatella sp. LEGE 06141]